MRIFKRRLGQKRLIVGVGSALVDILIHESDAFLVQTGAVKGGMTLVDPACGAGVIPPHPSPWRFSMQHERWHWPSWRQRPFRG